MSNLVASESFNQDMTPQEPASKPKRSRKSKKVLQDSVAMEQETVDTSAVPLPALRRSTRQQSRKVLMASSSVTESKDVEKGDVEEQEPVEKAKADVVLPEKRTTVKKRGGRGKKAKNAVSGSDAKVTDNSVPKPKRVKKDNNQIHSNAGLMRKSLPPDILFHIMSYAIYINGDPESFHENAFLFLQRFGMVCRDWRGAMYHHPVWNHIAQRFSMGEVSKNAKVYKTYYQLVTLKYPAQFCHLCMTKVETRKGSSKIVLPFVIDNKGTILRACLCCRVKITKQRIGAGMWRGENGVQVVFKKMTINQGQSMDKYRLGKGDLYGVYHQTLVRRGFRFRNVEYRYQEENVFEAALIAHGGIEGLIEVKLPVPAHFVPSHLQAKHQKQEEECERERLAKIEEEARLKAAVGGLDDPGVAAAVEDLDEDDEESDVMDLESECG
ncbi:hypothetical protein HDU76_003933 [Blyttiomyces sp. JEL0837]|nr:hypothetical protein HDU76_003933 [Blyttiomyces sp. JEL0837]